MTHLGYLKIDRYDSWVRSKYSRDLRFKYSNYSIKCFPPIRTPLIYNWKFEKTAFIKMLLEKHFIYMTLGTVSSKP